MFLPRFRKIRFILNTTAGVVLTVLFVSSLISSALLVNNTTRQYVLDSFAGVDFGAGLSQTSGEYQDYKAGKTKIPSASDSKKDKQTTKEKQTEKDKQIQTGGLQQSSGGKQTGSSSTSSGGSGSSSSINPSSSQWNVPSNPNNLPAPSQSSSGSQGSQNKQPSPQKPGATVESCGSGISTSACFCTTTNCYWNDSKGNTHSVQKGTEQHQNLITAITQGGIVENKSASGGSYGQIGIDSNNDGRPDYNQPLTQEVVDQIAKEAKLKQAQNAVQSYFGKTARPDLNTALQICANAMGGQCDQSLVNTITQQVNQINKINQIASSLQSWVSYQIKQGNTPDANQIYQKCLNSGGGTAGCDSISAVIDQLAAQTATIKWVNSQISSGKKPTESQINYECQKAGGGNACSSLAANIIDSINKATNKIQTQDTDEGKQQFMQQANLAEARTKVLTGQITSYEEAKKISSDYTESQFNLDRQKYHQAVKDSLANNFPQSQVENKTAITGTYGTYGQKAPKIQTQVNNVPSQSPVTTNNPNLINPNLITGGKTRGNVPTLTSEILYQQQVTTPQQLVQTGKIVGGALVTTAAVVGLVMAAPAIITAGASTIATAATTGSIGLALMASQYGPQIANTLSALATPAGMNIATTVATAFLSPQTFDQPYYANPKAYNYTPPSQSIRNFAVDVATAKVFSFGLSNTLQAVANTGNLGGLIVRGTDFLDNADDTITAGKCIASGGGDAGSCYETLINAAIGPQDMLEIPYSGISLGAKAVGKVIPSLNPPNTVSINGFNIELARNDPSNLVIAKNQITSSPVSPNINIQTNSSQTTAPNQLSPQQIAILATSQTKTPSTTPSKTTTEKTPAEITKIAQEPTKTTTEKTPIQTTEKKEESPTKQTTLAPEKSEFIAAIIEDGNRIQNTLKESSQNQYSTLALIADLAMYNHTSIPREFKQEIEDKIPTTMANLRLTGDLDKSLKDAGVSENTSNWIKNFIENQKGKQIDFWGNTGVQEKVKEMIAKSGVEESTAKEIVESTIIGNLDKNSGLVAQTITPSQESSEKIKEELAQAEETNTKEMLNNISNTSTNVIKSIIDGIAINTSAIFKNASSLINSLKITSQKITSGTSKIISSTSNNIINLTSTIATRIITKNKEVSVDKLENQEISIINKNKVITDFLPTDRSISQIEEEQKDLDAESKNYIKVLKKSLEKINKYSQDSKKISTNSPIALVIAKAIDIVEKNFSNGIKTKSNLDIADLPANVMLYGGAGQKVITEILGSSNLVFDPNGNGKRISLEKYLQEKYKNLGFSIEIKQESVLDTIQEMITNMGFRENIMVIKETAPRNFEKIAQRIGFISSQHMENIINSGVPITTIILSKTVNGKETTLKIPIIDSPNLKAHGAFKFSKNPISNKTNYGFMNVKGWSLVNHIVTEEGNEKIESTLFQALATIFHEIDHAIYSFNREITNTPFDTSKIISQRQEIEEKALEKLQKEGELTLDQKIDVLLTSDQNLYDSKIDIIVRTAFGEKSKEYESYIILKERLKEAYKKIADLDKIENLISEGLATKAEKDFIKSQLENINSVDKDISDLIIQTHNYRSFSSEFLSIYGIGQLLIINQDFHATAEEYTNISIIEYIMENPETIFAAIQEYESRINKTEYLFYGNTKKSKKRYLLFKGAIEGFIPNEIWWPKNNAPLSSMLENFRKLDKEKQNTIIDKLEEELASKLGVQKADLKPLKDKSASLEEYYIDLLSYNSSLDIENKINRKEYNYNQITKDMYKTVYKDKEYAEIQEIQEKLFNLTTSVVSTFINSVINKISTSFQNIETNLEVSKNKQKTPENQLIASAINKIRQNPSEYTLKNFSDKQFYINPNNITDYQRIALQESLSEIKRWEALTKKDINTLIKNTKDIPTLSEIVELEEISSVSDLERFAQKYNIEIDMSDYRDNEISLLELKLKLIPHITDKRFEAGFDEINKKISPYFQERANERLTSEEFESLLQKSAELTDLANSTSIKNLKLVMQARFILNYISRTKDISPETQERLINNLSHIMAIYNIANFQDINGKGNLITQISKTISKTAGSIANIASAIATKMRPKTILLTPEREAFNKGVNDYIIPKIRESIEKTVEGITKNQTNNFRSVDEVKNYMAEKVSASLDYQILEQILIANNISQIRAKEIIESQKSNIEKIIENEISKYKITIGPSGIAKKGLLALSDIHGNLEYLYHLLIGQETKVNIITKLGENQQVVNLGPSKITPVLSKETFVELIQNQPSEKKDGRYKIILLGDYTDQKGVSTKLADRIGLVNIIENLSKSGRADVILLLGNHDVNTIYRLVTGKSILPEINSAGYSQIDSMSGMTPEIRNKLIEFMRNTQAMHFDAETGTLYIHCDGDFYTRYGKTPREINEKISLIIENFIRAPQIPANQQAMENLIRLMTQKETSRNLTTNPFAVRNLAEIVFNEYKVYPKMIVHGHSPVDSSAYTKSPTKKIEIRTKENKDLLIEILDIDYSFSKNKGAAFYIPPLLQQSISITKEEGTMLPLIIENTTKQIKQATSKITKTILTGLIAISIFVGALTANITDNASRIYHQVADNRPRVEQVIQLEQPKTAEETKQETKLQPPAKESTQEKQEIKKETFQFLRQNQEPWGSATVKTQKGVEVKFKNVSCGATVVANILAINGENITPPEVYQRFFPEDQDFLLADYQVTGAIKKALPNAKISQVRNTATIAEIEKYIQDENTVAVIAVNSGKQKTDEAEHITLAVATKDGKLLLQDPLYGEMSCKGGGGSFVCSPLAGGTDITYWIHSINTIKLPSPKYNFKGDLINKDTSQTSIRPTTSSQDALYKAVIIDPSTFNSELANADYQQYNDQKYLPYFAQASQIIEPGNTQFSLLAQTIYQTERGSLYHKAGLGGINTGMIKKNNKYYPSRTGVIFHTLYRTDKLRPDENLLRRAAEWIGLDANSKDIRDLILNSYYHPNEEIATKTQAFISTLILHQAKEQYGPWLAPLHYVTGNADKFINQFTSVASSREEAIEIANEVIVDLFRFVWRQPPLYGHKFENFRTLTYKAINEYGREYIAYTHEAEVVIDNKRITIRLDAIQYLMKTEGDPRLGFFERYNKLAYDQNLINEDQGSAIYQYPNRQHEAKIKSAKIMIMGDSIAQSLASGAAQNIMQKELSESSKLEEFAFIGNQYYSSGGVANQAYRGVTALKLYEKIKSGEITFTSANTPDIVIIQLGVNEIASGLVSKISDIQEKFITPYHKIIDSIRQANPKAIILISPVPDTRLKNSQLNKNMNLALLEMVKYLNQDPNYPKSRVVIVNNGKPLYTDLFVSSDGVHPTQAGIISMAEGISQTITEIIDEINSQATSSVLDKNKKSIILGSGPAQWFENLSNATFYKWFPEARTKGLLIAIWERLKLIIKVRENNINNENDENKTESRKTQENQLEKIINLEEAADIANIRSNDPELKDPRMNKIIKHGEIGFYEILETFYPEENKMMREIMGPIDPETSLRIHAEFVANATDKARKLIHEGFFNNINARDAFHLIARIHTGENFLEHIISFYDPARPDVEETDTINSRLISTLIYQFTDPYIPTKDNYGFQLGSLRKRNLAMSRNNGQSIISIPYQVLPTIEEILFTEAEKTIIDSQEKWENFQKEMEKLKTSHPISFEEIGKKTEEQKKLEKDIKRKIIGFASLIDIVHFKSNANGRSSEDWSLAMQMRIFKDKSKISTWVMDNMRVAFEEKIVKEEFRERIERGNRLLIIREKEISEFRKEFMRTLKTKIREAEKLHSATITDEEWDQLIITHPEIVIETIKEQIEIIKSDGDGYINLASKILVNLTSNKEYEYTSYDTSKIFNRPNPLNKIANISGATEEEINSLAIRLTGFEISSQKIVDKLIDDHYKIKEKYNLPPRNLRFERPQEHIERLAKIAEKNNIKLINSKNNPNVLDEYLSSHPSHPKDLNIFYDEEEQTIFYYHDENNISALNLVSVAGDLEHELIHALQYKKKEKLDLEGQEYEAYVGANLTTKREILTPEIIAGFFDQIMFSVNTDLAIGKKPPSTLLGSGPAQWFENLSNATFYKWFPEARTDGLIPAIWNKIKRQENPDTKKPEKSKTLDKGTQMQIVEKIRNTFNLPNNLSEKGKNTEIIFLDKEEFIEAILLYYEKKDIIDLENRFPENDEFNQIANALGTSIEELRNNKTIQEALIRDRLEKLDGVVLDQNIYIPKLETTTAKEEIDFIITHELIHTMANQDNGISGFQAEDGSYHILNEAATQILALHVLYPELDEKGLIDKINSGEIKIGYTRPTIQLLTLLYTTSLSEEKVTIKDLARYYFNNDGTAPMLLAMQIKRGSLPQVAKQVDKILNLFLFNEKDWEKD